VSTAVSPTVENVYSFPATALKLKALLPELYVDEYCIVEVGVILTLVVAVPQYCENIVVKVIINNKDKAYFFITIILIIIIINIK
jgi:hypothetical protein